MWRRRRDAERAKPGNRNRGYLCSTNAYLRFPPRPHSPHGRRSYVRPRLGCSDLSRARSLARRSLSILRSLRMSSLFLSRYLAVFMRRVSRHFGVQCLCLGSRAKSHRLQDRHWRIRFRSAWRSNVKKAIPRILVDSLTHDSHYVVERISRCSQNDPTPGPRDRETYIPRTVG